jgi:hypothetical protein
LSGSGQERRKHPRYPVDAPARITAGGVTRSGRLRDVCRDAAFVEIDPFPLQTAVTLDFDLPDREAPVQLRGTIIRVGAGEYGTYGMAVLFTELTPEAVLHIDVFISQQEQEREREHPGS